jgi:hypothetical protein
MHCNRIPAMCKPPHTARKIPLLPSYGEQVRDDTALGLAQTEM